MVSLKTLGRAPNKALLNLRDAWARKISPNPAVKVFLGAPASSNAASEGYVNISTLTEITLDTKKRYSSFGGVMLWEASEAYSSCSSKAVLLLLI